MTDALGPVALRHIADDLTTGRVTSLQLVRHALSADVPGAIETRLEGAIAEAADSDRRRAIGQPRSRLDGIPFGVKANLDLAGVVSTNGTGIRRAPAIADAQAVAILRRAGLVPTLVTTQAEAAMGAITDNPHTGICPNPLRPGLHAGGSSGGSAAVVAAAAVPMALGSDTMGSVRIPAAYCGIAGYKPGRGAVPVQGLVPLAPGLDTVGVLAAEPDDLMLTARILFGAHPDPRPRSLEGLLVAVPRLLQHCDDAARRAVGRASALLSSLGARIEVGTGPDLNPGQVRRLGLLACELGLLDEYHVEYCSGDTGLSPPLRRLLDYADHARRDPHRIETLRSDLARLGEELGAGVESAELTLLPTTPGPVPALTEDPPTAADLTAWVNVAGLPAVSLPIGAPRKDFSSVQLIGRAGSDLNLLAHAAALGAVSREVPEAE